TAVWIGDEDPSEWPLLRDLAPSVLLFAPSEDRIHKARKFFEWLKRENVQVPVLHAFHYVCPKEDLLIQFPAEAGSLLCDGLGDGVLCEAVAPLHFLRELSFGVLQAARMRSSKTEFISCPSCGRTLFDLQEVSRQIEARTQHLPGVKIAVMGCIVNGPGEMADADFGYVGSQPGKIDLYVGRECVEKNIDFADAEDRLVALIKAHGRWVEADNTKVL
ncbi:MAG: flavodoxin-dependent (E)-4-hydroxy-3-methylbut-2-enyl-diphosphate synthase, partial [Chlamydiia bacterium]|nr:flavodoxin-dependent (E)-4-hydroxy-3-methylbut-2-enyl-diphosphate synthase [Chlamydiia bacterium]